MKNFITDKIACALASFIMFFVIKSDHDTCTGDAEMFLERFK